MIDSPSDLEFVRLVKSGSGYPGGLRGLIDSDLGATPTFPFEDFVRATMVPAPAPVDFLLSDDCEMSTAYDYLWPTATMVPVSTSIPTGEVHRIQARTVFPGLPSMEETAPASTTPPVDWVDLVPLIACGLFLSVLVFGMLLTPSSAVHPGWNWSFVPDAIAPTGGESAHKHDGLHAALASPLSSGSAGDAPSPCSSPRPSGTSSPPPVLQVQATTERPRASEHVDVPSNSPRIGHHPWWISR